jgi:hypothetical protein
MEPPAITKLGDYLTELARDTDLLKKHVEDPEGAVAEAGLSPEHQQVLLSGDLDQVRAALQDEGMPVGAYAIVIIP